MIRRNAFRFLAGALILGAMVHVLTLWPRVAGLAQVLGGESWVVVGGYALSTLTALAACGLAALLLWKAADRAEARALTLFLAFLAFFWGSLFRFMEVDTAAESISVNLGYGSGWVSQTALMSFLLMFPALLRFSTLFPRPLTAERLPPLRLERSVVLRAARRIRIWFLDARVAWGSALVVYLLQRYIPKAVMAVTDMSAMEQGGTPPAVVMLALLGSILLMAGYAVFGGALAARNLGTNYRLAVGEERRRVQWVFAGFATAWWLVLAGAGLVVVSALLGGSAAGEAAAAWDPAMLAVALPLALFLAPLLVVVGAAIGILYAGAIDPALALEKSTIYGILGVLGLVTFAALESVLSELLEGWVPLPGLVGPATAGAVVALALVPVRKLVRRWVAPGEPGAHREPGSGG